MKLIESTNCTSMNITEIKFELKINLRSSSANFAWTIHINFQS